MHVPGHPDEAEAQLRAAVTADGPVYLRLSLPANAAPFPVRPGELAVLRTGSAGTVLAVGPMADAVLAATAGLDVTVLYATTIRPFDAHTLRATLIHPDVVLVEPYLTGTSVPFVAEALRDIPHRVLALGVGRQELRRYGTGRAHSSPRPRRGQPASADS